LKNVNRYFWKPKWMKNNHEESTDKEKPQIPSETVDYTDKEEEPVMDNRPVPLKEITEIFKGPTSNSIISPTNVEDLESLAIKVDVEVL
jgi:hypothetical protein